MSIEDRNRIRELEIRVVALEKKLAETAESLAYLHGKVLGGPEATLPAREMLKVRRG